MPIRESLNASPVTLADVLGNGKRYVVPPFQRDYAWTSAEWEELWADIVALSPRAAEPANHYLGALVLQPSHTRNEMNIIDGQQRLVTLSLLALAIILRIERLAANGDEAEANRERARLLRERFVSTKDPASLVHHSRLRLNAHDDGFYQTYLVQGARPSQPSGLKGSERRLWDALQFFEGAVARQLGTLATGAQLAAFLDELVANHLRFIEIRVEDDETAFTVFETLNARGIALGTADLLKNYLFAVASQGGARDLALAIQAWERVLRFVPMEDVASLLFHQLAGRVPELREKRVFAEVKRLVPGRLGVFDFLRELAGAAEVYAALDDADDELWSAFPDAGRHIRLLRILGVEQHRPVVLAAFSQLQDRPEKLTRLLRNLGVILLRAVVARVNTGDLQRAFHAAALRIAGGELKSPATIARALAAVTPSDDTFEASFATLAYDPKSPRKRLVRYLLAGLERQLGGAVVDVDLGDATIEHILPENPPAGWEAFSQEDRQRYVQRLGNLTPLERSLNQAVGSATYETKHPAYQQSRYALTRHIDAAEWTPEAIAARQRSMAAGAARVWRLDWEE